MIVDISKNAQQSLLYISYTTEVGRIAIQADRVQRPLRREDGLFFNLLSKLDSLLPKAPEQKSAGDRYAISEWLWTDARPHLEGVPLVAPPNF